MPPPPVPEPIEAAKPRPAPQYYVLRVHSIENGEPGLVSVISGPYVDFAIAWYSTGAIRRIYPTQMFVAGELCLF